MAAFTSNYWKNIAFLAFFITIASFYVNSRKGSTWWNQWLTAEADSTSVTPVPSYTRFSLIPSDEIRNFNACRDCLNRHSRRVFDSYQRYLSWVNPSKGPSGKERIVYGIYQLYDPADCLEKSATAFEKDAQLFPQVQAYRNALQQAQEISHPLYRYYDHEEYLDDKMRVGKTQHRPLVAAFDAYYVAAHELGKSLNEIQDRFWTHFDTLSTQSPDSQAIIGYRLIQAGSAILTQASTYQSGASDMSRWTPLLDAFMAQEAALNKIQLSNPKSSPHTARFLSAADTYTKVAQAVFRRQREGVPFTDTESHRLESFNGWMVKGSVPALIAAYNDLVLACNAVLPGKSYPYFGTLYHFPNSYPKPGKTR